LSWSDEFEDPLPGFRTLHDAANYIQKLPKATQQLPHWQNADANYDKDRCQDHCSPPNRTPAQALLRNCR
jgi:hypothetical protein